jgi:hypothetical protein
MEVVERREMDTRRLDDIPELREADMLKLDAQGAELDVLQGGPRILGQALVVHTEVEFVPLYHGQPLFADVDQHLRQAGFQFHRFGSFAGRTFRPVVVNNDVNHVLSQFLWAEALYVRDFMRLHELSPARLLKLAVIMHYEFNSFDLVHLVLTAYDAQAQTKLAPAYLQRLTAPKQ